jgi:ATP-binding cassette, subfamily B, bacterial
VHGKIDTLVMSASPIGFRHLVRPHRALLTAAFAAMVVESAASLWEPWPLKLIVDNVLGGKPLSPALASWALFGTDPIGILNAAVLAVMTITAIGAVGAYTQKYLATAVAQRVTHDLRRSVYRHLHRLPLPFFELRRTGDLMVRLTSDVDTAGDFFSATLLSLTMDVLMLAGMVGIMAYLDWRFTLLALAIAPLLFFVVLRRTHRIKQAAREVKQRESALASLIQEVLTAIRTVRAFGREDHEEARLDREGRAAMEAALQARSLKAALPPIVDLIVAAGTCAVMLVGVRLVLSGRITSGTLIVFVLYLTRLYKPIKNLARMTETFSKVSVAFERIRELLQTPVPVADAPGARPAPPLRGRLELRDVRFRYQPDVPVLNGVDLTVEAGERVAIVGATGAGKSTLLALLLRLYAPSSGSIAIDGHDVRGFTARSLRDQISFVPQEPVLFHAPLWENIAYGRPGATRDDIVRAATLANAHEFIARLPRGYDTIVGERGETLSGGQRQRVAIARAVVRRAPILLLDEPSAALDPESEALVFEALSRLMTQCTSITVAHRLATVTRAQRVFVLEHGTIVARGTHDELLASSPAYARLFALVPDPDASDDLYGAVAV